MIKRFEFPTVVFIKVHLAICLPPCVFVCVFSRMNKIAMEQSGESDVFSLLAAMEGHTHMEEIE